MEENPRVVRLCVSRFATLSHIVISYSSGDIGVSATLVLHGTPPFQVYYTEQRDTEPAREQVKTFSTTRGELTIQPERSGHYIFKFTHLSDMNYQKVDLKGPSIDQVVHPPASAEFVQNTSGSSGVRAKRRINSCSGNMVDVDVELRVGFRFLFLLQGCD